MTDTSTYWVCDRCNNCNDYPVDPVTGEQITTSQETCDVCDEYIDCEACGRTEHIDYAHSARPEGSLYCGRCSSMAIVACESCDDLLDAFRGEDHGDDNIVLCRGCREYNYTICEDCGGLFHVDNVCWIDEIDQYLCEYCEDNRPDNQVQSYSYKPHFRIFGRSPENRKATTFGVELEVEYKQGDREGTNALLRSMWSDVDVTFLKSDGSLSNGVEAVSHPMTLDFARNNINREALASLGRMGVRSWNTTTCGLHIHIGRDTFLNHSHLARFLILFTRSRQPLVDIAGRDSDQWASFELSSNESLVKQAEGKQYPQTRYRAVNLSNEDTVEVRVFRGSLNPDTIIAHMELLAAMVEYTREQRQLVGISTALTWGSFRIWLHTNRNDYPAAQDRCVARADRRI